jgi:hypothetical protein
MRAYAEKKKLTKTKGVSPEIIINGLNPEYEPDISEGDIAMMTVLNIFSAQFEQSPYKQNKDYLDAIIESINTKPGESKKDAFVRQFGRTGGSIVGRALPLNRTIGEIYDAIQTQKRNSKSFDESFLNSMGIGRYLSDSIVSKKTDIFGEPVRIPWSAIPTINYETKQMFAKKGYAPSIPTNLDGVIYQDGVSVKLEGSELHDYQETWKTNFSKFIKKDLEKLKTYSPIVFKAVVKAYENAASKLAGFKIKEEWAKIKKE